MYIYIYHYTCVHLKSQVWMCVDGSSNDWFWSPPAITSRFSSYIINFCLFEKASKREVLDWLNTSCVLLLVLTIKTNNLPSLKRHFLSKWMTFNTHTNTPTHGFIGTGSTVLQDMALSPSFRCRIGFFWCHWRLLGICVFCGKCGKTQMDRYESSKNTHTGKDTKTHTHSTQHEQCHLFGWLCNVLFLSGENIPFYCVFLRWLPELVPWNCSPPKLGQPWDSFPMNIQTYG